MEKASDVIEFHQEQLLVTANRLQKKVIRESMKAFADLAEKVVVQDSGAKSSRERPWNTMAARWLAQGLRRGPIIRHVFVHNDWPMLEGHRQLLRLSKNSFSGTPKKNVARWIKAYNRELSSLLTTIKTRPIFVEAADGNLKKGQIGSLSDERGTTGFLNPQALSHFFHMNEGYHSKDTIVIHGATFDCCPRHIGIQIASLALSFYFPPEPLSFVEECKNFSSVDIARINGRMAATKIFEKSGISMGTQMDCKGEIKWPSNFAIQTMRGDEKIFPWCLTPPFHATSPSPVSGSGDR
jgi:hypothetical protein